MRYKFFWNGPFSNWYPSPFEINGLKFNCGEQYMMYHKAMTFNDKEAADLIMSTDSPRLQKKIGRSVKNYNDQIWKEIRYDLVKLGLKEKFLQNPDLKRQLLYYKGSTIVEASPEDRIWGIGFAEYEAQDHFDEWGENLLGKILTELSNEL